MDWTLLKEIKPKGKFPRVSDSEEVDFRFFYMRILNCFLKLILVDNGPNLSTVLEKAYSKIWTQQECVEKAQSVFKLPFMITNRMLCWGEKGLSACSGDSGGPLVVFSAEDDQRWHLYGITSWGPGCAQPDTAGVYTRVTTFLDWIKKTMRQN